MYAIKRILEFWKRPKSAVWCGVSHTPHITPTPAPTQNPSPCPSPNFLMRTCVRISISYLMNRYHANTLLVAFTPPEKSYIVKKKTGFKREL